MDENLSLSPEEAIELETAIRVLMGTIMKTNQFMLSLTNLNDMQKQEIVILLDIYASLYDQFLTGEAKDKVIFDLTKGKLDS